MKFQRNNAKHKLHRKLIARDRPPCHICGGEILWDADYLDPKSFVVDHIVPLAQGGTDTIDNKKAAHRDCNRAKSDRLDGGPILRVSPMFD